MNPEFSVVASLLSDESRAAILSGLMDGKPHPASELALLAYIKPQTASFHLSKLLDTGIVGVEKHGRHRYYKLINQEIAGLIETLYSITPQSQPNSFREVHEMKRIHYARTCYDHLAGFTGVKVTNALVENKWIEKKDMDFVVTKNGERHFAHLDIDTDKLITKRRSFARCCLDWSEREHHLAGALGHAFLEAMFERKWLNRISGTRAVEVTEAGKLELKSLLSVHL